jgi:hypothetical protein
MKNHRIHQRAFETAPSERRLSGRPVGLKVRPRLYSKLAILNEHQELWGNLLCERAATDLVP